MDQPTDLLLKIGGLVAMDRAAGSRLGDRVKRWWQGEDVPPDNDPRSMFVIMTGSRRYHWSAKVARAVVFYVRDHHRYVIATILTAVGVLIAIFKLK